MSGSRASTTSSVRVMGDNGDRNGIVAEVKTRFWCAKWVESAACVDKSRVVSVSRWDCDGRV